MGLREVYESNTPRMIRDGVPVSNGHYSTHGAMVEVLVNGQFGYFGTPDLSKSGIDLAAKKAFEQAKAASVYALHHFTDEVRPKNIGKYSSPFEKDLRSAFKEIDKKKRSTAISEIETKCKEMFAEDENVTENQAMAQLKSLEKDIVRTAILKEKKRIDGRGLSCLLYTSPSPRDRG